VHEQREAGPVGPLEVLEDEQQRALRGGAADDAQRGIEPGPRTGTADNPTPSRCTSCSATSA
jgi:hypothetical protein